MMERERISPAHIDLLRERARLSDYVAQRVILVERAGEYSGLCPFHTEKSPSFTVNDSKGFYHCFGCGAHGNVFDWLMNHRGLNFVEAVHLLESDTGLDDPRDAEKARADMEAARKLRAEQEAKRNEKDLEGALSMWKEARAPQQSAVSLYLRWRGVTLPDKSPLKCHPSLPYWYCRKGSKNYEILGRYPAMLAAIQGPDGSFIGVHRTYLSLENGGKAKIPDPDNPGKFLKPKKMKGAVMGGAIRLSAASRKMAVAEGIENGLTAMMVDPDLSVWVAGSLNNICGRGVGQGAPIAPDVPQEILDAWSSATFEHGGNLPSDHPLSWVRSHIDRYLPSEVPDMQSKAIVLPDIVEELLIIGDNDGQDRFENQAKLNRAGNRFTQQGLSVRIALPDTGKDLNDMLQGN
jgi:DNA primase